jgi:hypothetical protein
MITYTVKYKLPNDLFWKKIKKVEGDGILETGTYRFFSMEDGSRVEIPLGYIFEFGKERFLAIKMNMEKTAGQPIITEKG